MRTVLHKNLVNITTANTLSNFGGALIEVFVPILLIKQGLTLVDVAAFYLAYSVIKLIVNYQATRLTNRFGARPSLVIARLAYIMYLLCLIVITSGGPIDLVWPMAGLLAFTNAFQLSAQHIHLSRVIDMKHKGQDIARIEAINMIAMSIAPAFTAVLALVFSVSWPLYMAIGFILLSMYWLRSIDEEAGGYRRGERLKYSLSYAPKRDLVANFAHNFHSAIGGLVWPMYLALVLPHIQSIGIVTTVGSFVAVIFLLFIGNRNDNIGTHRVLGEGSVATFCAHLLRLIPASVLTISVVNVVWQLASRYQQNPWTSTYYAHTREKGIGYILSMEIANDLAYVVLFVSVLVALYVFGYQIGFMVLFVLAAFASLVCTKITPAAANSSSS